jgi:hypothetical protein
MHPLSNYPWVNGVMLLEEREREREREREQSAIALAEGKEESFIRLGIRGDNPGAKLNSTASVGLVLVIGRVKNDS